MLRTKMKIHVQYTGTCTLWEQSVESERAVESPSEVTLTVLPERSSYSEGEVVEARCSVQSFPLGFTKFFWVFTGKNASIPAERMNSRILPYQVFFDFLDLIKF